MAFYISTGTQHPLVPVRSVSRHDGTGRSAGATESVFSLLTDPPSGSQLDADQEWVVFSPQLLSSQDDTSSRVPTVSQLAASDVGDDEDMADAEPARSGALTPLAFPSHNGSGMFMADVSDLTERVNAWRLDQSQLVLREMQRLERKFFGSDASSSIGSFGLGGQPASSPKTAPSASSDTKESLWNTLTRKVIRDFIGLNDEVLEVIFGERFIDDEPAEASTPDAAPPRPSQPPPSPHFNQSFATGPPKWDSALISRIFADLKIPMAPDISILRYLGAQLFLLTHGDRLEAEHGIPASTSAVPGSPNFSRGANPHRAQRSGNYWEDSTVSSYWEQSSASSTRVW